MIEAKNISISYGGRQALSEICAKFGDGEFTAILGANGAGKSTLLKLLSGWLAPCFGEITYGGQNIKNFGARELATKRAVLEQECTLDFEYTVGQIVGMGGFSGGLFGAQARPETVSEALAAADLEGFENRIYSRLSGGEKRRAQLARALCQLGNAPQGKALLLDEPAASLDPRAAHSAMKAAASAAEKGACVVAVLHDPNLAFDYCGRAILLKQGKIYASGKTEDALSGENLSAAYSHRCEVFDSPFGKTARFPKIASNSNS